MNALRYLPVPLVLLLAAGCEKNPLPGPSGEQPEIRLTTAWQSYTRVRELDFEPGDQFGLYLQAYEGQTAPPFASGRLRDNLLCTKRQTGVDLPRVHYPAAGKVDFYAYYPYSVEGVCADDPEWLPHTVRADQSDPMLFDASDLLTAATTGISPTEEAVPLTFAHRMSLVQVQLLPGEGLSLEMLKNARMTTAELASECRVNLLTGAISDPKGAVQIVPSGNQVAIEGDRVSVMSFVAIPQTIPAGTELLDIVTGNMVVGTTHYTYVTDREIVLRSGYKYRMEITLRAAGAAPAARITAHPR